MAAGIAKLATTCALCLGVASCGGGGGGGETPTSSPAPASGQLDAAFGTAGKAVLPEFASMLPASAGDIYLTGSMFPEPGVRIARLDASGAAVPFAIAPAGSVGVALVDEAGAFYFMVAPGIRKVDAEGRLVPSFGVGGLASNESWDAGNYWGGSTIARDRAGNLYLAGSKVRTQGNLVDSLMAVAKFDREGRVVSSFGSGGMRVLEGQGGFVKAVAVDDAGNVYLGGSLSGRPTLVVVKLNAAGELAADFAAGGIWMGPECGPSTAGTAAMAIDASGNLIVAGGCPTPGSNGGARVFKLDARGAVISSFREGGTRGGLFGGDPTGPGQLLAGNYVNMLLVGPAGEIYAAGARIVDTPSQCHFAVAKLDANGNPVAGFAANGVAILDEFIGWTHALALDREGRLYVGGLSPASCFPSVRPSPTQRYVVHRLGS
jgi:hypothetical protein